MAEYDAMEDWKSHLARDLLQGGLKHAHQQIDKSEVLSLSEVLVGSSSATVLAIARLTMQFAGI